MAGEWIVQLEKIFRVFECFSRQRVQLAAYMFCSVTKDWWRIVQAPYEMLTDYIAWIAFRTDFLKELPNSLLKPLWSGAYICLMQSAHFTSTPV